MQLFLLLYVVISIIFMAMFLHKELDSRRTFNTDIERLKHTMLISGLSVFWPGTLLIVVVLLLKQLWEKLIRDAVKEILLKKNLSIDDIFWSKKDKDELNTNLSKLSTSELNLLQHAIDINVYYINKYNKEIIKEHIHNRQFEKHFLGSQDGKES